MSEMDKRRKLFLQCVAIVSMCVFLVSGILLLLTVYENHQTPPAGFLDGLSSTIEYNGKTYQLKDDVQTFLILGLDKFDVASDQDAYRNDRQSDFVMLLVIDNKNETCSAIHINRDSMVDVNVLGVAGQKVGTVNQQLALAHTYGNGKEVSCGNVADSVSGMLYGVKIDHYVSVTMDAVPILNDLVGGVEVTVLDDFSATEPTWVKGENVTLMGEQALTYIRSRKGLDDPTNANRMVRQQQYLNSLYHKTMQAVEKDSEFVVSASMKVADYTVSDCTTNQLQSLFEKISSYQFTGIHSIEGDSVVGEQFMEFYPDVDSLKRVVIDLFYKEKKQ